MKKGIFFLIILLLLTISPASASMNPSIYLDVISGSDSNDGSSSVQAVQTFSKAMDLLQENGIIYLCKTISVTSSETYSAFGKTNVSLQPVPGFSGPLFSVETDGHLILENIKINAAGMYVPYLETASGSFCTILTGTSLYGSHIISLLGGSINNSGTLIIEGGEVSADSSTTISNLGTIRVSSGSISAGAPPAGKYYYAITNLYGTIDLKNCQVRASTSEARVIIQSNGTKINIGGNTQITGSVILSQNAYLTVTEPLDGAPPITLEPESGLIPWAYHGAVLVKAADSITLSPSQFELKAPGFVLQSTSQGDLMLRDPSLPSFSIALAYSSLVHDQNSIYGGVSVSLSNNTERLLPLTAILVFYHQDGSFAAAQYFPLSLPTEKKDFTFFITAIPDLQGTVTSSFLYIWKDFSTLEPLCPPLSIPIRE